MGDTTVNKDGVTITGGPSVTKNGIDAGNKKLQMLQMESIQMTQ
ncbi:autotransporter adhesin [Actinobacillus equuli]|nr:autotransporter adhesin [Actinobacillus equuli]